MHALRHQQMLQRPGVRPSQQHHHHHAQRQQQQQRHTQRRQAVIAVGAPTAEPPAWLPPIFTPQRVALFVEPSPFSHISGMKNRFESLIKTLREAGDDVMVVTPDPAPPAEFCGAQVGGRAGGRAGGGPGWLVLIEGSSCRLLSCLTHVLHATTPTPLHPQQVVNVLGFKLPFYKSSTLLLSLGLSLRVLYYLFKQKPQVIHVSTPGIMCFAAGVWVGGGLLQERDARCSRCSPPLTHHHPRPCCLPPSTHPQCCTRGCCPCRWSCRTTPTSLSTSLATPGPAWWRPCGASSAGARAAQTSHS
jgi:hypothetical protein